FFAAAGRLAALLVLRAAAFAGRFAFAVLPRRAATFFVLFAAAFLPAAFLVLAFLAFLPFFDFRAVAMSSSCCSFTLYHIGGLDVRNLAVAKPPRKIRLQHVVGAGRTAAQMIFGDVPHGKSRLPEQLLGLARDLLAVLQRAGGLIGDGEPAVSGGKCQIKLH